MIRADREAELMARSSEGLLGDCFQAESQRLCEYHLWACLCIGLGELYISQDRNACMNLCPSAGTPEKKLPRKEENEC